MVSLIVAGCGGSSAAASPTSTATATATATTAPTATSVPTATTNPNQATVNIIGGYSAQFSFSPATTTIKVGMTVVWTNASSTPHTSTSDAGSAVTWDSGLISPGATFSFTFTRAGTFTYHCNVHAYMHGTIVVTA
jgi:plastocyanin